MYCQDPINSDIPGVSFYNKDIETIKVEFQELYGVLNGTTSTSLYESYFKFYQYILYFEDKKLNIYEFIPGTVDNSIINKHILASIRIYTFLDRLPTGAYIFINEIKISYWKKIKFENWNNVRKEMGLGLLKSKNWREGIIKED